MKTLIGYTGFVGGNINRKEKFDYLYNSKNISQIRNKSFDLVISAGTPAIKWLASKEPEKDFASIKVLMDNLKTIKTKKFVLISTVDVYPNPIDVNETNHIDEKKLQPYGKHRRILEEFCKKRFDATIIRLPALFGEGLKKNIIYDLINNHLVKNIHQDGIFQFYNLDYMWEDIKKVINHDIKILNVATEPISVKEITEQVFNLKLENNIEQLPPQYDFHTKYAKYWGKNGCYLYNKKEVLSDLKNFVKRMKDKNEISHI